MIIASIVSLPLIGISVMAQPGPSPAPLVMGGTQSAPSVNSPAAHKSTTVTEPDGKVVTTPPVGMRSGDKNVGGD